MLRDIFCYQQTRTNGQFYVYCGIDLPTLLDDVRESEIFSPDKSPKMLITINTGRLLSGKTFGCKHEEHIDSSAIKVTEALESEAEFWFGSFATELDVIEYYREREIGLIDLNEQFSLGKVTSCSMYALMLYDVGDVDKSIPWLKQSRNTWQNQTQKTTIQQEWIRVISNRISIQRD
jgi:hypothetical protein